MPHALKCYDFRMSWNTFKQHFGYNYKKFLAIIFCSIAVALLAASGIIDLITMVETKETPTILTPLSFYNFAIMMVVYLILLIGNIKSNNFAYNGMLMYIFMTVFSAIEILFISGIVNFQALFSLDAATMVVVLLYTVFQVAGIVAGIFAYIRTRQYLTGSAISYINVRNWALIFVILQIISTGLTPALYLLLGYSANAVLLAFLEPISEVFICLGIYFTVLRLRSY